jgi:hypothetical protein
MEKWIVLKTVPEMGNVKCANWVGAWEYDEAQVSARREGYEPQYAGVRGRPLGNVARSNFVMR